MAKSGAESSSQAPPPSPAPVPPATSPQSLAGRPQAAEQLKYSGTPTWMHNAAIAVAILGPIGILLPGGARGRGATRVLNMILGVGAFWGMNQLAHDYTGKSIVARSNERWAKILAPLDPLPAKARANKALMEAERLRREAVLPEGEKARLGDERGRKEEEEKQRGLLQKVWMGNETDDWKKRRVEEDKKALESGKGYADIIMDQIWEVWNQGKDTKPKAAHESQSKDGLPKDDKKS